MRTTPHRDLEQHRGASGRRWYYGDDMQPGMPRRYIYDHTPLMVLIELELDQDGQKAETPKGPGPS